MEGRASRSETILETSEHVAVGIKVDFLLWLREGDTKLTSKCHCELLLEDCAREVSLVTLRYNAIKPCISACLQELKPGGLSELAERCWVLQFLDSGSYQQVCLNTVPFSLSFDLAHELGHDGVYLLAFLRW